MEKEQLHLEFGAAEKRIKGTENTKFTTTKRMLATTDTNLVTAERK